MEFALNSNTPEPEISFSWFSRKPSTLDDMLIHKFNINVTIAVILSCKSSLYDLQGRKYRNSGKKGVAADKVRNFPLMRTKFSDHSGPCENRTVVKPTKATQIYGILASSWTIRNGTWSIIFRFFEWKYRISINSVTVVRAIDLSHHKDNLFL